MSAPACQAHLRGSTGDLPHPFSGTLAGHERFLKVLSEREQIPLYPSAVFSESSASELSELQERFSLRHSMTQRWIHESEQCSVMNDKPPRRPRHSLYRVREAILALPSASKSCDSASREVVSTVKTSGQYLSSDGRSGSSIDTEETKPPLHLEQSM
jgi:hypothetical protein